MVADDFLPKFDERHEYKHARSSMTLGTMNSKRPTLRHIIIKLSKDKENLESRYREVNQRS